MIVYSDSFWLSEAEVNDSVTWYIWTSKYGGRGNRDGPVISEDLVPFHIVYYISSTLIWSDEYRSSWTSKWTVKNLILNWSLIINEKVFTWPKLTLLPDKTYIDGSREILNYHWQICHKEKEFGHGPWSRSSVNMNGRDVGLFRWHSINL